MHEMNINLFSLFLPPHWVYRRFAVHFGKRVQWEEWSRRDSALILEVHRNAGTSGSCDPVEFCKVQAVVQRLACVDPAASWAAFASGVFPKNWSLLCGWSRSRSFVTFIELYNDLSACLSGLYCWVTLILIDCPLNFFKSWHKKHHQHSVLW